MLQLNTHHVFQYDGNYFLINIGQMSACIIDEDVFKVLEERPKDAPLLEHGIREKLEKLALLPKSVTKPVMKHKIERFPISHVVLFVTQQCNMRCTYCYGNGGSYGSGGVMTSLTARKAVDWFIEQSRQLKKLHLGFFGGEPLLNFHLIREVIHYANERGQECNKQFAFGIATNGLLLDDEKIAFFKDHGITPHISIDGPKELQDTQRPLENGKGSYDIIAPRIKKLLKGIPDTPCRATVVETADPVAVDNALREMGFKHRIVVVASQSLFETSENNTGELYRNFSAMHDKIESEVKKFLAALKSRDVNTLKELSCCGHLAYFIQQFVNNHKKHFHCGAGKAMVAVSCSGDVYLCHRFVGMEEQRLGDIFSGTVERETYLNSHLKPSSKCTTCYARYICVGGCYHDNLGITKSIFEPAEDMCVLVRRSTEFAAAVCSHLSDEDKEYLFKEKIINKKACLTDLF